MANEYLKQAQQNLKEIRDHRRDFHKHPELGFKETRTARIVAEYLESLQIEVKTGIAQTGVVGLLRGGADGKTVAVRADIDALPMQEKNTVPYASVNQGVSHACGHDAHVAMLMETARLLAGNAKNLKGNVKFIFQPCEDMIPSGAEPMIQEGVMENPHVDAIFTTHVSTGHELGTMWVKSEYISISSADFELVVKGTGGHVSQPQRTVDPISISGMIITDTQVLMQRSVAPWEPMIFAFGKIHAGTANNIIPDHAVLSGTIRAATPDARQKGIDDFERMVDGITSAAGGSYSLEVQLCNPSIYNDPEMVSLLQKSAAKVMGEDAINELPHIMPGGDDAAFFQQKAPGAYWILGARNEAKGFDKPGHSPYYDFDEDALPVGAAVHAQAVTDYLGTIGDADSPPRSSRAYKR